MSDNAVLSDSCYSNLVGKDFGALKVLTTRHAHFYGKALLQNELYCNIMRCN